MFDGLVKELGGIIGLPKLGPDESGALTLVIDGEPFILQYFEAGDEIYIIHRIGTLPESPEEQLAAQRFLLERNCFFREVGPGVLGTEGDAVFYTVRLPCRDVSGRGLSGAELEHVLRAAADICIKLRAGYAEGKHGDAASRVPTDMSFLNMLRV